MGHTGTLDPFAEGLLVILVGKATRLARYLVGLEKTYIGTMQLGVATDTLDATGKVTDTVPVPASLADEQVMQALAAMEGRQTQIPPLYSARKVRGVPAYRRARKGEDFVLDPSEITVHELKMLERTRCDVTFHARVSSGTYIRALARDIGKALGLPAHLKSLRRSHVGRFSLDQAVTVSDVSSDCILPPLQLLQHLESCEVSESDALKLRNGLALPAAGAVSGPLALVSGGRLVAVGEYVDGELRPRVVLR